MEIRAFDIPHDAAAPSAFLITSLASGERAGIAHDLGEVPDALVAGFRGSELLLIEANHDVEMLRNGPYPPRLQERIRGRFGHLSNAQSAEWAVACAGPATRDIVLLHLSEQNNTPEVAERTLRVDLARARFRGRVHAASRKLPSFVAGLNGRAGPAVQLTLSL
jgi:phosphoribosyl 1,2-cyclic phosphodiesterase